MLGTSKSLFAVRMGLACVGVSLLAVTVKTRAS